MNVRNFSCIYLYGFTGNAEGLHKLYRAIEGRIGIWIAEKGNIGLFC